MTRNTITRSLHDLGLAAWFGGTLANAVALNPAAAQADVPDNRGAVANEGWDRWTPVNAVAIGAHLIGGIGLMASNADRIHGQKGVASMTVAKTALTAAALGVTAYSRVLGKKVDAHKSVPVTSGTEPAAATPPDVAAAQKKLALLQWAIPALTGGLVIATAFAGEQQRASEASKGVLQRIMP